MTGTEAGTDRSMSRTEAAPGRVRKAVATWALVLAAISAVMAVRPMVAVPWHVPEWLPLPAGLEARLDTARHNHFMQPGRCMLVKVTRWQQRGSGTRRTLY